VYVGQFEQRDEAGPQCAKLGENAGLFIFRIASVGMLCNTVRNFSISPLSFWQNGLENHIDGNIRYASIRWQRRIAGNVARQ
jgi:hypothetical protein